MSNDGRSPRNYGIDALRLCAAFLIAVVHVMGVGGVQANAKGANWVIALLLYIPAYCGVDCFALISGYVGYSDAPRPQRLAKYLALWFQVLFYNLIFAALSWTAGGDPFTLKSLLRAFLPVTTETYWYFTAYTGVFLLSPWLNRLVRSCTRAQAKRLALVLVLLFSCYATAVWSVTDVFSLEGGYNFLWLAILYVLGALMRKLDVPGRVRVRHALLCGAALWLITLLTEHKLFTYISPTMIGMAAVLLVCFSKLRLPRRAERAVRFLAPSAFGVYLAHVHPWSFHHLLPDRFASFAAAPFWEMPLLVWGSALGIVALCLAVDKLRGGAFRIARIPQLCDWLEARARALLKRLPLWND